MGCTASFIKNNVTVKDSPCFSGIVSGTSYTGEVQECHIIIEKSKWIFSIKEIRRYLNDLKKMGWKFTYRLDKHNSRFIIDVNKLLGTSMRVSFFTAVRFLWEGTYGTQYEIMKDHFTETVRHYNKLKELLPKEKNELRRLCIAANAFIIGNRVYASNHYFAINTGCKLRPSLKGIENSGVNSFFTDTSINLSYNNNLAKANDWTIKDYKSLFKQINYEPVLSN